MKKIYIHFVFVIFIGNLLRFNIFVKNKPQIYDVQ